MFVNNELINIIYTNQNDFSFKSGYQLTFVYANYEMKDIHGNVKNTFIVQPFHELELEKRDNSIIIIELNLTVLDNLFSSDEMYMLENLYFDESFLNEIEVYLKRYLELVITSDSEFEQYLSTLSFIDILRSNFLTNVETQSKLEYNKLNLIEIQKYIHENFRKNISLQSLSDQFNYSLSYLSRIFKKDIGIGFNSYLKNIRLSNSQKELIKTKKTITEIALDNGFGSSSSFNRIFKESFDITPTDFRQNHLDQQESFSTSSYDQERFIRHLHSKEKIINKSVDGSSRLINRFSPLNRVLNIDSISFFESSINKNLLVEANKTFKSNLVRFKVDINKFVNEAPIRESISNIIETLNLNNMYPFISIDLTYSAFNHQSEIDIAAQQIIQFFIKEINHYNLEHFSNWFIEFQLNIDHSAYLSSNIQITKIVTDFLALAFESSNIVIHLGQLKTSLKDYDYTKLEEIKYKYLSTDLYLDQLHNNLQELEILSEKIVNLKNEILSLSGKNSKMIISSFNLFSNRHHEFNDSTARGSFYLTLLSKLFLEFEIIAHANLIDKRNLHGKTLYGGDGLFTSNGLLKGIAHAFIFLRKLGASIIDISDGIFISKKSYSDYVIILSNFQNLSIIKENTQKNYNLTRQFNFENLTVKYNLTINNIISGTYKIKTYHSKNDNKNLVTILDEFGDIEYLQGDELETIQFSSRPELSLSVKEVNESSIRLEYELAFNEFLEIYLYYQY